jgi:hypothetical protein
MENPGHFSAEINNNGSSRALSDGPRMAETGLSSMRL